MASLDAGIVLFVNLTQDVPGGQAEFIVNWREGLPPELPV
jgi:hypothetical protein